MKNIYVVQTAGGSFLAAETGYGGRATFTTHASEVARFDEATARLKAAAHNGRAVGKAVVRVVAVSDAESDPIGCAKRVALR